MANSDPTTPNAHDRKKIVSFVSSKMLEDFKIKLRHDNLKMSEVIRNVILAYLNNDVRIADLMKDIKKLLGRQSEASREKSYQTIKKGQKIAESFEMSEQEKKFLFDVFESEDKF